MNSQLQFKIDIFQSIDSTNLYLVENSSKIEAPYVVISEIQTHGRGRGNKQWFSNLGGSLTFSVLWNFGKNFSNLSGLSLIIALSLVRTLTKISEHQFCIKWPNDLLYKNQKVAGILIECKTNSDHTISAIIGIGINLNLHQRIHTLLSYPVSDLTKITGSHLDRNVLIAGILTALYLMLSEYEKFGFGFFKDEWSKHHCFNNKMVVLRMPQNSNISGIIKGVTDKGELILQKDSSFLHFSTGEISLRPLR